MNFEDIFGEMFGMGMGQQGRARGGRAGFDGK